MNDRTAILVFGCGLAAGAAVVPAIVHLAGVAAATGRRLCVRAFDRAELTEGHLAFVETDAAGVQRAVYEGRPGESKAAALARRLRAAGIDATAAEGNLTRWPRSSFRAHLAFVGLDSEQARTAAQRLLRRAGTPAIFLGLARDAGVHVFGGRAEEACYGCLLQARVPMEASPCVPGTPVSTRTASSPEARRLLADRLPALAAAALAGDDLGVYHALQQDGAVLRARIEPAADCLGGHPTAGRAAPAPAPAAPLVLPTGATLRVAFAHAGRGARLCELLLRLCYRCPACGRSDQRGADLVRRWPERERCRCGSVDVEPLARLESIDRPEAARQRLLDERLQDLGVVPGSAFAAELTASPGAPRREVHLQEES